MSAYEVLSNTNQWLVRFEGLKYDYALFRDDVEPAVLHGLGHAGFEYFHLFANWLVRFQRVLTSILTFFCWMQQDEGTHLCEIADEVPNGHFCMLLFDDGWTRVVAY